MTKSDLATLCGYASALPTPFTDDRIDVDAFTSFCKWQIEQGSSALVVNGTTGEAPTLTRSEQNRLFSMAVAVAQGQVPVIAGVGSNATAHAIELARDAERAGADGLLAVTPYYNKPSQEGLFQHFRAIHDATGLPILLYDVPARTGCELALGTLRRLAELPRIIGLKDATGDLVRPGVLRRLLGERFRLLSGDDGTALEFMALGGNGCISVLSNVVPKLCNRLYLAIACGEQVEARLIERRLGPLVAALFAESNPVPVKWALSLLGRMSPEVRLPLCGPSDATRTAVQKALAQLGLVGPRGLIPSAAYWIRKSPSWSCNTVDRAASLP
jgi:4-hydroxy-tetrahydrodipicolinate synthase